MFIVNRGIKLLSSLRTYGTNFSVDQDPLSESGNWIVGRTHGLDWQDIQVVGGKAYGKQTGLGNDGTSTEPGIYDDSVALVTGLWRNNYAVSATAFRVAQNLDINRELELWGRASISSHSITGYETNVRVKDSATPYVEIVRWNGAIGDFTRLLHTDNAAFVLADGGTMMSTFVGSAIKVFLNGVEIASYDTSTGNDGGTGGNPGGPDSVVYSTGKPGLGTFLHIFSGGVGDVSRFGWTGFTASEV